MVAINLIIAAIAIPDLLRARIAANESSAAASTRTIGTAQISYSNSYPTVGYSATLLALGTPAAGCTTATSTSACIIDTVLANGTKSGYVFTSVGAVSGASTTNVVFVTNSAPVTVQTTGIKAFCGAEVANRSII